MACARPARSARPRSSACTRGPPAHCPLATASAAARASASPKVSRLWGMATEGNRVGVIPDEPGDAAVIPD